ncbi:MAG TPA: hypothetical protein DCE41_11295 [Cytophagales bacterium]|nr:hypothetical protein [Cytophagales bacterium]HAA19654.1 hypothetical protein [Cytophagales bacterium]
MKHAVNHVTNNRAGKALLASVVFFSLLAVSQLAKGQSYLTYNEDFWILNADATNLHTTMELRRTNNTWNFYNDGTGNLYVGHTATNIGDVSLGSQFYTFSPTQFRVGKNLSVVGTSKFENTIDLARPSGQQAVMRFQGGGRAHGQGLGIGQNSNGTTFLWNWNNSYLHFGTNSTERMRIAANGKVGINTGDDAINHQLDVKGDARIQSKITSGIFTGGHPAWINGAATRGLLVSSGTDNAFFGVKQRTGTTDNNSLNAVVYFGDDIDDNLEFVSHNSGELMRLTAEGYLGIGGLSTADPTHHLEVNGTSLFTQEVKINPSTNGTTATLKLLRGGGNANDSFEIVHEGTTGDAYIRNRGNKAIYFGTNDVGRMWIAADGKVGIGSNMSSPSATLDVNGNGNFVQGVTVGGSSQFNETVTIGTSANLKNLRLYGTAEVKEIHVDAGTTWADFVFADDYQLRPLREVEAFIQENKHLPEVPSEEEVATQGYSQTDLNATLLQKIEELTLYVIELEKKVENLEADR